MYIITSGSFLGHHKPTQSTSHCHTVLTLWMSHMNPWTELCTVIDSIFHRNCPKPPLSPGFEQSLLSVLPEKVTSSDWSSKPNSSGPLWSWVPWVSSAQNPSTPKPQSWDFSTDLSNSAQTVCPHGVLQRSLKAPHGREEITISSSHANHVNTLITLVSPNCQHNPAYPAVPGSVAGWDWIRWQGWGVRTYLHTKYAPSLLFHKGVCIRCMRSQRY